MKKVVWISVDTVGGMTERTICHEKEQCYFISMVLFWNTWRKRQREGAINSGEMGIRV